ncbi:MAG: DUF2520 domain-containing protein [Brumimicrobium sp.]
MGEIKKIVIIGTGNIAHHLGMAFLKNGIEITGIWGRSKEKSNNLSSLLHSKTIEHLDEIPKTVDLVLICVSDTAIKEIVEKIPNSFPIAYTSGSINLESLPDKDKIGVFYPLQTFSLKREVDISKVPFLLESNNKVFCNELKTCARKLSNTVHFANSKERFQLHLAAVIVNNFTNHLFVLAEKHLEKKNLSFELLKPLILETAQKIQTISPSEAQTGPAKRNDLLVIKNHLDELDNETKSIYQLLSDSIIKHNK